MIFRTRGEVTVKWLARIFWLAAWGAWVWLGAGLHRELPRNLSPVSRRLPLDRTETPIGFVESGELLASYKPDAAQKLVIRVREPLKGELLFEEHTPWVNPAEFRFSARHGLIVGAEFGRVTGVRILDLRSGRWAELHPTASLHHLHPTRPWAVMSYVEENNWAVVLLVVDMRTKERLLEWKLPRGVKRSLADSAFFPTQDDLLCIPLQFWDDQILRSQLEVWKIGGDERQPLKIYDIPKAAGTFSEPLTSSTGRVVWIDFESFPPALDVLDVLQPAVVFSNPPKVPRRKRLPSDGMSLPTLSPDGKGLYCHGTVWDVDRHAPLWSRSNSEFEEVADVTSLHVHEFWGEIFGAWANGFSTRAVRDLSTGRVVFRLWDSQGRPPRCSDCVNARWQEFIDDDGNIRSFPPPPNWPLLAFCQTLLALPLVLLWYVLLRRRRRRAKQTVSA
jgi:hypothetical protein